MMKRSGRSGGIIQCLSIVILGGGCAPDRETKDVYRYAVGLKRPLFKPDPTKKVEWIHAVPSPGTVEDGPTLPDGRHTGGFIYHEGGTVGFTTGETQRLKPLAWRYLGNDYTVE